jgi:hypothetical protein
MAAALYTTQLLLPPGKTTIPEFLLLTLIGGAAYAASGLTLGAFDLSHLRTLLSRRRAKATAS